MQHRDYNFGLIGLPLSKFLDRFGIDKGDYFLSNMLDDLAMFLFFNSYRGPEKSMYQNII